mmetsp:Transcript_23457/g.65708  ORF Transcript_23457/g.65708 Transcript_23457/m.65708 type:complete len:371 (-) Transcript_23457:5-1117(-)
MRTKFAQADQGPLPCSSSRRATPSKLDWLLPKSPPNPSRVVGQQDADALPVQALQRLVADAPHRADGDAPAVEVRIQPGVQEKRRRAAADEPLEDAAHGIGERLAERGAPDAREVDRVGRHPEDVRVDPEALQGKIRQHAAPEGNARLEDLPGRGDDRDPRVLRAELPVDGLLQAEPDRAALAAAEAVQPAARLEQPVDFLDQLLLPDLELHVQARLPGQHLQHVPQERDAPVPRAPAERREVLEPGLRHQAAAAAHAGEVRVVEDHHLPVGGQADVELHHVRLVVDGVPECRHCVLNRASLHVFAASVCHHLHTMQRLRQPCPIARQVSTVSQQAARSQRMQHGGQNCSLRQGDQHCDACPSKLLIKTA